jgi:hypothetical protein
MARRTFVESIVTRARNADALATELSGARVAHVPSVPTDACQFSEACSEFPTFIVGLFETDAQNELEETFRYMCAEHALEVQHMVESVQA